MRLWVHYVAAYFLPSHRLSAYLPPFESSDQVVPNVSTSPNCSHRPCYDPRFRH
ncbi:hypothetical protein THIOM_003541 [Candidatus Thiomargarita nelsonii]|uniref:Uncharacterized protein n=1 Tax=Candidatus Thiomargarita nelsonii TaxID=1003181 RepID=A0A176RYE5_9GAMM|nr:hypothetical protein THIOM_003541 [Candidatus Thiomargarita nelsonii]